MATGSSKCTKTAVTEFTCGTMIVINPCNKNGGTISPDFTCGTMSICASMTPEQLLEIVNVCIKNNISPVELSKYAAYEKLTSNGKKAVKLLAENINKEMKK